MKKFFTKSWMMILAICLAMSTNAKAETITSIQDGNWNSTDTWANGVVPTTADSVVVKHQLDILSGDSCLHLYVTPAGTIQNKVNGTRRLAVMGNLWLDGTANYTNNYFNIHLGGNLHLNGIWDSPRLYFTGNAEQYVSASPGKVFEATRSGIFFENIDPASPLKFATDITFIDIELIMNTATLEFAPGSEVAFYGEPIRNANIIGNNGALLMRDGAFIEDSNLDKLTLKGLFNMGDDNTSSGELIIADTLQNLINGTRMLEVFGNFTNTGLIRETNNHFNFIFHGNVANSGSWLSSNIFFDGTTDQHINFAEDTYLFCDNVEDRDVNSKIILDSDWEIHDANVDLNFATLEASGQKFTLRDGAYLVDAVVNEATLSGDFICYNNCVFTGETTISDTLRNYSISSFIPVVFHDKLINNGIIRRINSYALNLSLMADFENNGEVDVETITLGGANDQTFYTTSKGMTIDVDQLNDTVVNSALILESDVTFSGTVIDLNGATIEQTNGNLCLTGGIIQNGVVHSNGHYIRQSDNARFINMQIHNAHLKGICKVYQYDNHFTDVTLDDTLQNYDYSSVPTLTVNGSFINHGVINNSNTYRIRMNLNGDFYNHGSAYMYELNFVSSDIQEFSSADGVVLNTTIKSTKPSGYILATDDLIFESCNIELDSTTIMLQNADIYMYGGTLEEAVIEGNDQIMHMHNAKALNVTLKDVSLEGTSLVDGYHNIMENVTVTDTLSKPTNPSRHTYIATRGIFRNNGTITKTGTYDIHFRVEDTVINNGSWYSGELRFDGTGIHYITSENENPFEIDNILHGGNGGAVEISGSLYLLNADVDLDNVDFILPAYTYLNLDNSSLEHVNLICGADAEIFGSNNALLGYSTVEGAVFSGNIEVTQSNTLSNCMLNGEMLNPDMSTTIYLTIENEFLNNGSIYNNPETNYDLYLKVLGNLNQNGIIQNEEARWIGTSDQDIYLLNGNGIGTSCEFWAMTGTVDYQWFKNETELTGETDDILDFPELLPADRGFYHCTTNEGNSRTIRICTPVEIDLAAEAWFCQDESVMLEPEITFGEPPYTWSWEPAAGLSDPNIQNPEANPETPTVYTLTVIDAIGCKGRIDILVQQYPQLYTSAGIDKEICYGQSTILNGSASGGAPDYTYAWTPETGLSNPNIPNPVAAPESTMLYTLAVTDANGCEESSTVNVMVNPLPQAFGLSQDSTHFCWAYDTIICWLLDSELGVEYHLLVNGLPNPGGEIFEGSGEAVPIWATTTVQGHYTLKGVNTTSGCEKMMMGSVMIYIDYLPEVVDQSGDEIVIEGESTTLWVEVTSTQPPWLQWYKDGEIIPGAQDYNLHLDDVNLDATGVYQCLVTNNCDIVWSDPISITVLQRQTIQIPAGWSGFSTYQDVFDADVNNMFDPLNGNLVILNDFENIFWPAATVNTYENWNTGCGAQIKLNESASLNVDGFITENRVLNLEAGWHYLPVLSTCPLAASDIFSQLGANLVLAKDIAGTRVYWLEYNIFTLNLLEPGKAYLMKLSGAASITFPDCLKGSLLAPSSKRADNQSPWPDPAYTATSHLILFTPEANNGILQQGDWLGVFNTGGVCTGLARYERGSMAISAFANDPTTGETDGLEEGECMQLKIFRNATGEILEIIPRYDAASDGGGFKTNGISVIEQVMKTHPLSGKISIYPNPSQGSVNIEGINPETIYAVYDANGIEVIRGKFGNTNQIDLGGLPSGIYTLKIIGEQQAVYRKVILK